MDWLDPFADLLVQNAGGPSGIPSNLGILGAVRSRALRRATVCGAGKVNAVVTVPLIRSLSFHAIRAGCAKALDSHVSDTGTSCLAAGSLLDRRSDVVWSTRWFSKVA
ncbi:hypothetical protein ACVWWN_008340 [Mycobacterium sp. URHB0021]|jgi:hypothetical protein